MDAKRISRANRVNKSRSVLARRAGAVLVPSRTARTLLAGASAFSVLIVMNGLGIRSVAAATGVVSCDHSNLQTAINGASAGATLDIIGTCHGNFTIGKNLNLVGRGSNPTLDGNGAGTVLTITRGTVSLSSLTVTNGLAPQFEPSGANGEGGGIWNRKGVVTLDTVTVTGNGAGAPGSGSGGGIANDLGARMTILNSSITTNFAPFGGGIRNDGRMDVTKSVISRNTGQEIGAGIVTTHQMTLRDSLVSDNNGGGVGGGISFGGTMTLYNTPVTANSASNGGGIESSGNLTLINSPVTGNAAYLTANNGGGAGGGIELDGGTLTVRNSSISNNTAYVAGGGIFSQSEPTMIMLDNSSIIGNSVSGNSPYGPDGGGIWSEAPVTLNSTTVSGNTAGRYGAGIYIEGLFGTGLFTVNSSMVSGNSAGTDGGGIYNHLGSVTLNSSSVTGNNPNNCSGTAVPGC